MVRVGRNVRVTGRVQGVFFRAWTREQADGLGVAGWVRNSPDGSVEAHLAGEAAAVLELVQRLYDGPPSAIVKDMTVEEVAPQPGGGFTVLR